ncbi:MAG: superinfection immunity protein [Candidatus Binataceae bacterium]|nr:superinfection immunity protein [Candidatus Binataceae bacterium]
MNDYLDFAIRLIDRYLHRPEILTVVAVAATFYLLWRILEWQHFSPHHRLWAYIVGLTFLGDTAAILWCWGADWRTILMAGLLPPVATMVYFMPTAAAIEWEHPNFDRLFAVNLFAGWTIVGWLAVFIWARNSPWRHAEMKVAQRLEPSRETAAALRSPIKPDQAQASAVRQMLRHRKSV